MPPRIRSLITAGIFALLAVGSVASAEELSPLSQADLRKLLAFVDSIGAQQVLPPPVAKNLGLSDDEKQELPVVSVVTDDHRIYFCRSSLNAKDYIIWVIGSDQKSSSMFVTHDDLKLVRAMYMRTETIPQLQNVNDDQVVIAYNKALAALAQDLRKTKSP